MQNPLEDLRPQFPWEGPPLPKAISFQGKNPRELFEEPELTRFEISQYALKLRYNAYSIARHLHERGIIDFPSIPDAAKAIETIASEWYAHFGVER